MVEAGNALQKALEIAERLAKGPSVAITASKVPINMWIRAQSAAILPLSLTMEELSIKTSDAKEAGRAFVEKRPPNFTGR